MNKHLDVRSNEETAFSVAAGTSTGSAGRSDMVRGTSKTAFAPLGTLVPSDTITSPDLLPHLRAVSLDDEDERATDQPSSQMNQGLSEINSIPTILQRDATQTKKLHTQVPNSSGSKDKFNEFEDLLINHLQPHQHKITEENKLHSFQSLPREGAINLWQTLRINSETNLRDVLIQFRQNFAHQTSLQLQVKRTGQ